MTMHFRRPKPRPWRPHSRLRGQLVHPGRILFEEILRVWDISQNTLALTIDVPPRRINEIVLGKRAITVDTAIGLEKAFGLSAHYWMALQADYDIAMALPGWSERHRHRLLPGVVRKLHSRVVETEFDCW